MHRRSGRISFLLLAGIASLALVALLFAFSGRSATAAASDFMSALAVRDASKLAEYSVIAKLDRAGREKAWTETLRHTKYFRFAWRVNTTRQDPDGAAIVVIDFVRHPDAPGATPELLQLPMTKQDGDWKVDVTQISREFYPYLPR